MNNTIIAYNTHYTLYNYHLGDIPELEKFVSIFDDVNHKYIPLYSYDDELGEFRIPRGLDPAKLQRLTNLEIFHNTEFRARKITFGMKLTPRNSTQKRAIRFLTGKEEYNYTGGSSQLVLSLPSGGGKTYCAVAAMSLYGVPTLIITHNDDIRNQWVDRIRQYSNIPKKSIVSLSSSAELNKYLASDRKTIKKINNEYVYIVTHSLLRSYVKTYGSDSLNQLVETLGIGIKIIDECHKEFYSTIDIDNSLNVGKNWYLTATFARTDDIENRLFQRVFEFLYKLKVTDDEIGVYKNVIYITELMTSFASQLEVMGMMNGNRWNPNKFKQFSVYKYIDYQFTKTKLVDSVKTWLAYFVEKVKVDGTIIIMSPKKDSCDFFYKLAKEMYPTKKCCIHTSDSKVDDVGVYDIACATSKMIGTGNDIDRLKVIINAEPIGSKINAYQVFHRLMRGNDEDVRYYVEIVDKSVGNVYNMYKRCSPSLEENAKKHIIVDTTKKKRPQFI